MTQYVSKDFANLSDHKLSLRVTQGGLWVFLLRGFQQLFSLIKIVILARILAPNDFGLMGVALLSMATLETFSQTGFHQALIQKKEDINKYLDTAWTIQLIRGFILFGILYFAAPYLAVFFEATKVKAIIRVIGLSILLEAFTNIGVIYFQKELEFNKQFLYQLIGSATDFIVSISAVLILKSVWAIVFGLLAGNTVRCFISYLIHPYKPRLSINLEKTKELFDFGKWVFGSSILTFLLIQGDDIFVGKFLGIVQLGFYRLAYRISNIATTEITQVISKVTYPAYSKLQDDPVRLRNAFLKVLHITALISLLIAGLTFALADNFTLVFLGEKWMSIVPVVSVLVWWSVIRGLAGAMSPVFLSIGKFKIVARLQALQVGLLFILIYPLTYKWALLGTSLAVLISALLMFFIRSHILIKTIACKNTEFYKLIAIPFIITVISTVTTTLLNNFICRQTDIFVLALLILVFMFLSIFCVCLFDRPLVYQVWTTIKNYLVQLKAIKKSGN